MSQNVQEQLAKITQPGCALAYVRAELRRVRLRPTQQRIRLGLLLFGKGHRHMTADTLYREAKSAKFPVSRATVYNILRQFTAVGLVRKITAKGSEIYFDTNVTDHHHFVIKGADELVDISASAMSILSEGYEIARIDAVVRLRRLRIERANQPAGAPRTAESGAR